jgi:hypothetical protein
MSLVAAISCIFRANCDDSVEDVSQYYSWLTLNQDAKRLVEKRLQKQINDRICGGISRSRRFLTIGAPFPLLTFRIRLVSSSLKKRSEYQ